MSRIATGNALLLEHLAIALTDCGANVKPLSMDGVVHHLIVNAPGTSGAYVWISTGGKVAVRYSNPPGISSPNPASYYKPDPARVARNMQMQLGLDSVSLSDLRAAINCLGENHD